MKSPKIGDEQIKTTNKITYLSPYLLHDFIMIRVLPGIIVALFACQLPLFSAAPALKTDPGGKSLAEIRVKNCAVPGANTRESLARLPKILRGKPDYLVILFGINDAAWPVKFVSLNEYGKNLMTMTEIARKSGVKSVFLVTIHPVNTAYLIERHPNHPQRKHLQEHLDQYNAVIRKVAKKTGAVLVDWRGRFLAESPGDSVESAVANRKDCLLRCQANCGVRDGCHPTANGYRILAEEVGRALRGRVKAGETVLCFGDSITFGSHMEGEGTTTGNTYPAFLKSLLNSTSPANADTLKNNYGSNPGRLANAAAPDWALKIKLPNNKYQLFTSSDKSLAPIVSSNGQSGNTYYVWHGLGAGSGAGLTVTMTRSEQAVGMAWDLNVENRGEAALWEVTFPDFKTVAYTDDTVLLPTVSGRLHPASKPLAYKSKDRGHYPSGLLTMQCAGLYGKSGGVYISVHDPFGSSKRLEVNCKNGRFELLWRWPVPDADVPGTGWEMPGDLLIRPFEGDWFDIAQIYRAWASEKANWWPRGAQAGRPDTPQWFKDNPVWIMSNGPWPKKSAPLPIDQAVAKIKHFADYMGDIPCAVHWYNWHKTTYDNDYPHYFPADDGFAEKVKEVQAAGVRVMPYINAHIWDTDLKDFETVGRPAAVKSINGSIPTKSYAGNTFAPMCPATPLWQKTVKDLVLKLAGPEYGVNGIYLDQVSAQAAMLCYDKNHGHPLGGGCWWTTQGYWPMLDEIRKSSPGTILTSESTAEPYVNRLDGYLSWLSYREGNNAVPLFHAVYGGQVQLFGRLYKWDSWKGVAMRTKTAQTLVWGEQLGWIIPDVVDDPVAGPFLKRLARMRYRLNPYLSRGQMARPPKLKTDGSKLTSNWVYTRDLMVTTPTVFSGAWMREDNKAVALILVNADDKPHSVILPFNASAYGLEGDLVAREWTGTEELNVTPAAQPVATSWNRKITLVPMASLAIEIEVAE